MANIGHFMIPADNVERVKHFYHTLLGWKIEPTRNPMDPSQIAEMQYHDIITGAAKAGMMNAGGKRQCVAKKKTDTKVLPGIRFTTPLSGVTKHLTI
jgi:predicted enzyme related to lactoylglutathione lyase